MMTAIMLNVVMPGVMAPILGSDMGVRGFIFISQSRYPYVIAGAAETIAIHSALFRAIVIWPIVVAPKLYEACSQPTKRN
jgi:hypothetical protein